MNGPYKSVEVQQALVISQMFHMKVSLVSHGLLYSSKDIKTSMGQSMNESFTIVGFIYWSTWVCRLPFRLPAPAASHPPLQSVSLPLLNAMRRTVMEGRFVVGLELIGLFSFGLAMGSREHVAGCLKLMWVYG